MGAGIAVDLQEAHDGVSIHGSYFDGNLYAIQVRGERPVTISNNEFVDNAYAIVVYVSGVLTISSNTIENLSGAFTGVYVASTSTPGTITIRDTTIDVGGDPVVIKATNTGSQFIMEECTTKGYRAIFIQGSEAFAVDLGGGPQGSHGGNSFTARGCAVCDMRPSFSGAIYAKNNTWDNPQPTGTANGPIDNPPYYEITNEGNSIIFSE